MELKVVRIEKTENLNFVLGQTHFIKSVEDIHEACVNAVPGIKFGLAFCEASGDCLIRTSGTDQALKELATKNAVNIAAGHTFILILGEGFYPLNVLNSLKMIPEEVIIAQTAQGRGIMGVVDGFSPKGVEKAEDVQHRKEFLRKIGYKQ